LGLAAIAGQVGQHPQDVGESLPVLPLLRGLHDDLRGLQLAD
jgi:hypothetical protein